MGDEQSLDLPVTDLTTAALDIISSNQLLDNTSASKLEQGLTVFGSQWYDSAVGKTLYYGDTVQDAYVNFSTPLDLLFERRTGSEQVVEWTEIILEGVVAKKTAAKVNGRQLSFTRRRFQDHSKWLSERIPLPDMNLQTPEAIAQRREAFMLALTCMYMTEMLTIFEKIMQAPNVNGNLSNSGSSIVPRGPMSLLEMIDAERPLFAGVNKDPAAFVKDVEPYLTNSLNRANIPDPRMKELAVVVCSNKLRDALVNNSEAKKLDVFSGKEAHQNRLAHIETTKSGVGTVGNYPCVTPPRGAVLHDKLLSDLLKSEVQVGDWFDFQNTTVGRVSPQEFKWAMRTITRYNMEDDAYFDHNFLDFLRHALEFQGSETQDPRDKSTGQLSLVKLIEMGVSITHTKQGKTQPPWTSPLTGVNYESKEHMVSPLLRHTPNNPTDGTTKYSNSDKNVYLSPVGSFVEIDQRVGSQMGHFYDVMRERLFAGFDDEERALFAHLYQSLIDDRPSSVAELYDQDENDRTPEAKKFLSLWERVVGQILAVCGKDHWAVSTTLTSKATSSAAIVALHERLTTIKKMALNASHTVLHSFRPISDDISEESKERAHGTYSNLLSGTILGDLGLVNWDPSASNTQSNPFKRRKVANDGVEDIKKDVTDKSILNLQFKFDSYRTVAPKTEDLPRFVRHAVAFPITHYPPNGEFRDKQTDSESRWAATHSLDILTGVAARVFLSSVLCRDTFVNFANNNVDIALGGVVCSPFQKFRSEHCTGVARAKLGLINMRGFESFRTNFSFGDAGIEVTTGFSVTVSRPNALAHCKNVLLVEYMGGYGHQYFNHGLDIMNRETDYDTVIDKFGQGDKMKNNCMIPILCGLNTSLSSENIPPVFDIRNHARIYNVMNRLSPNSPDLRPQKTPKVDGIEFMLYVLKECNMQGVDAETLSPRGVLEFETEMKIFKSNYICGRSSYEVYDPNTGGRKKVEPRCLLGEIKPNQKMRFIGEAMVRVSETR